MLNYADVFFQSTNASSTQYVNIQVHSLRGDSPPSRNSYHSSDGSSSLGSLERLDESGLGNAGGSVNVAEMLANGCSVSEMINSPVHYYSSLITGFVDK